MLKEMLQIMSKLSRLLSLNLEHVLLYRYESIQSPVRCSQRIFKKNCVLFAHDCYSLSQTRGSIPLFWSQRPNLRYKPVPLLNPSADHVSVEDLLYYMYILCKLFCEVGQKRAEEKRIKNQRLRPIDKKFVPSTPLAL